MLGLILKSSIAFCASYVILSFQVNNIHLFDHINELTGPVGENIQKAMGESFARTWKKTKRFGEQLFTNAEPKLKKAVQDKVDNTQSAIQRHLNPKGAESVKSKPIVKKIANPVDSYLEELKREERDGLTEIIRNN